MDILTDAQTGRRELLRHDSLSQIEALRIAE